jgi:hypothetical protein
VRWRARRRSNGTLESLTTLGWKIREERRIRREFRATLRVGNGIHNVPEGLPLSPAAQVVLDAIAPRHIPWWTRLANALKPYFGQNIRDAIRIWKQR